MTISEKLKKIREIKKITQEQLANELNIAFATVNRWEKGTIEPNDENMAKIEKYCEVNGIMIENNQTGHIKIITASQLKNWFSEEQNLSRGLFPELIERLIKESCDKIDKIIFPSGDNINIDGIDGELIVKTNNKHFIPNGHSYWELGATTITSSRKISTDFYKRTREIPQDEQKNISFVLITPKVLTDKNKKLKKNELTKKGSWQDICIIDGIDLEEWLSRCVMTSMWLLNQYSNKKLTFNSLYNATKEIKNETTPSMSLRLYTISRENEIQKLYSLIETKKTIKIAGSSLFESYRFVVSSLSQNCAIENRVIICSDFISFSELDNTLKNIVIVANFTFPNNSNLNPQNTHIIILGKEIKDLNYDILLTPRPQQSLYDVLKNDMKIDNEKLQSLQHRANNNVMLIVRELSNDSFFCTNEWLKDPNIKDLVPIVILGQVNLQNDIEKSILSKFLSSNENVDDYISNLRLHWENKDNSPLFIYNNQIKVILREEVWVVCGELISSKINNIFNVLNEIFYKSNPKYNLSIEKQNFASLYSANWEYSSKTVEGLLDSLILLTIHNNEQSNVDNFIKSFLKNIDTKEKMLSVSQFLPLIAEASPSVFAQFVYEDLKQDEGILDSLFISRTNGDILLGGHEYCELLWAIEKLTYIEETKFTACNCLFLLTERNYEYKISNTPKDSLITALHWMKKNALTYKEKENVVNDIVKINKEKAYFLPLEIMEKNMISYSSSTLKWKNAILINSTPTYCEIFDSGKSFLLNIFASGNKLDVKLVKRMIDIQRNLHYTSLSIIKDYIYNNYIDESFDKNELYEYCQQKLYQIFRYEKEEQSKPLVTELESMIKFLKPKSLLKASLLYYKNFSYNGCPNKNLISNNFEKEEKKSLEFRTNLFSKLTNKYPIEQVVKELVEVIPNNSYTGSLFYNIIANTNNTIELVIKYGLSQKKYEFTVGFINNLENKEIDTYIDKMDYETVKYLASYYSYNRYIPKRFLKDSELTSLVYSKRLITNTDDKQEIEMIKKYNPIGYITWLCRNKQNITQDNVNEICGILLSINADKINSNGNIGYYEVQEILKTIDNGYYNEKVVKLCFQYLKFFEFNEIPNSIKTYFFLNPKEYIEFLTSGKFDGGLIYHFDSFMSLPNDFNSDEEKLQNFINEFRNFNTEDKDIVKIVRSSLGQILARTFRRGKDNFLDKKFMSIIEDVRDNDFNNGIIIGYFNSRGVRTVGDGSDEMEKYQQLLEESKKYQIQYPESSRILKAIADDYYRNAQMDKETRLKIDGLL